MASARHCACLWALGGAARDVREAWGGSSSEAAVRPLGAGVKGCGCDVMGRVAVVDGRNDGFTSDV